MLVLQVTVNYLDHRQQTVTVLPVTQVAFERHFHCSFSDAFSSAPQVEHVYFLAWHAARTGIEFDAWLETVEGIVVGDAEPVDPTSPTVSAGQ